MWSEIAVQHLLREWISKPYQCARGGIVYSFGSGRCVVSICPNDKGWSDPATHKLFRGIRDLGWGLVFKQPETFKDRIKMVSLVPPPERKHRDMDRPGPIFDHADLGTREPNDPELRGIDPGHPMYYLLGGRPLQPEEIEPDHDWELPSDTKLSRLKDRKKREKRLLEMREGYGKELQEYIARYLKVITPGYQVSEYDRKMGYGLETAIFLCHNHIKAGKGWLAAINRELAKYQPPLKDTPQREWALTHIPQAKQQQQLGF